MTNAAVGLACGQLGSHGSAFPRPAPTRFDFEPDPVCIVPKVLAQRAVRAARIADGRAAPKLDQGQKAKAHKVLRVVKRPASYQSERAG
jgi:hypothetical protein